MITFKVNDYVLQTIRLNSSLTACLGLRPNLAQNKSLTSMFYQLCRRNALILHRLTKAWMGRLSHYG